MQQRDHYAQRWRAYDYGAHTHATNDMDSLISNWPDISQYARGDYKEIDTWFLDDIRTGLTVFEGTLEQCKLMREPHHTLRPYQASSDEIANENEARRQLRRLGVINW